MSTLQSHSSIQVDKNILFYSGENCKYYYLPLFEKTLIPEPIATALGANNHIKRTPPQIRESLIKAEMGRYSHVKVPIDRIDFSFMDWFLSQLQNYSLKPVLQICVSFLFDREFYEGLQKLPKECEIEWVIDKRSAISDDRFLELSQVFESHCSIVVHKETDWQHLLRGDAIASIQNLHLYFSYQLSPGGPFLNCKQAHRVVGMLRKQHPLLNFLPPKGVDLWDHRANFDFDMEPVVYPCFETQSANPKVKYSVIIPTYNNQNHLRVVLKHLYKQNVGLDEFEVIVVDDGGTDRTQSLVMKMLSELPLPMNFKYVFFQRHRKRIMGDSQYRAGISRNLGVKNCVGEILCFLDSDIITPPDYLAQVGKELETSDALQAKRINLSQPASSLNFDYEKVNEKEDCISDEPYWEEFIKTKDWHLLPYSWKYVCTHSFSIKKDLFWKVGGLKKNFIFYGFEDTDLGYRLVKNGYKLKLLDLKVFHMFHENARSEFMNLTSLRHSLLSRTAQIFYLHHLDEDIYENLLGFMEPEPTFRRLFDGFVETVSLQFLWRPRPNVYRSIGKSKG